MRKSREELIVEAFKSGIISQTLNEYYRLPHEEKVKKFKDICIKEGGYYTLLMSDEEICDNKELVLFAKEHGFYADYHLISERLLNDKEIALAFAKCNRFEYSKISKSVREDAELMAQAVAINSAIYSSLPVKTKIDRGVIMSVAERQPSELQYLSSVKEEYRNKIFSDKEIGLVVAKKDPNVLYEYFDESVLSDNIILETVFSLSDKAEFQQRILAHPWGVEFISPTHWRDDIKIVKTALYHNGNLLEHMDDEVKNNKQLVLIAVGESPDALRFCSSELKDDKDVVIKALQPDTEEILSFASTRLRGDYDIVLKAVKCDPLNLQYASEELKDNRNIVLSAVKRFGGVLENASLRLQNDPEIAKIAEKNM